MALHNDTENQYDKRLQAAQDAGSRIRASFRFIALFAIFGHFSPFLLGFIISFSFYPIGTTRPPNQIAASVSSPFAQSQVRRDESRRLISGTSRALSQDENMTVSQLTPPALVDHKGLNEWISEVAALCKPDRIHICDGSQSEADKLTAEMVARKIPAALFTICSAAV